MGYLFAGGAALVGIYVLYRMLTKADSRQVMRWARWGTGGALAALSLFLVLRGQIALATLTGPAAFAVFKFGRIGPLDFNTSDPRPDNRSTVRSRYIAAALDHETGEVAGKVTFGRFKGRDLSTLTQEEVGRLLGEVSGDPDSQSLLETWLDRNRAGWRETFDAGQGSQQSAQGAGPPPASASQQDAEAYEILGIKAGATAEQVRAAHRNLMMRVHPDQGGSTYLASKINAAKDRLLKKIGV